MGYGRDEVVFESVCGVELLDHIVYLSAELVYLVVIFIIFDSNAQISVRNLARNIADISQRPHYGTGKSKAEYSRNNNYNSRYKPDYKAGKAYLRINVLE